LYFFIDPKIVENEQVLQKFLEKNKDKKNKQEDDEEAEEEDDEEKKKGSAQSKLLNICKQFLAEGTAKIKRCLNKIGLNINKPDIKPTCIKVINNKIA
jgi:hypothetical protein